ncbi:hypothetical protein ACPRNU_12500 [Chromobacterium vaccinii]|uniref:hypothetical protein n=1 Tax=Chromobacterium vaccinii TaxID=1108595 RepID=UPI003C77085A
MSESELAGYVAAAGRLGTAPAAAAPPTPPANADSLAPIITQERIIPNRRSQT